MDRIEAEDLANANDPLVVCTFGRSGTHLLIDIVRRQFPAFSAWKMPGAPPARLFLPLEEFAAGTVSVRHVRRMLVVARRLLVRSHAWPEVTREMANAHPAFATWLRSRAKVLFVARDPVVALPKLWTLASQFREHAGLGPIEDVDLFVIEESQRWSALASSALEAPRTEIVLLERLLANPGAQIERLSFFLRETAAYALPLLIRPHRNRLDTMIARLHPCPRSTHVLVRARAQARYRFDWTPARLAMLDAHAGETMTRLGYRRPDEADAVTLEPTRLRLVA